MKNKSVYSNLGRFNSMCCPCFHGSDISGIYTAKDNHKVTFRVESSGGDSLHYIQGQSKYAEEKIQVSTPWEKIWDNPSGAEVYITAGNPTQLGSIKCILKIDGKTWKTDVASGQDNYVSGCSAKLCDSKLIIP